MKKNIDIRWSVAMAALAICNASFAALPADQIARLGKDLTPQGAEVAGNKEGTIPAWSGGITKPPAGFDPAKGHLDPFASEKPLFTISASNAEQYKEKLTEGQIALLKRYPTFKMNVYPSHRTAGYPQKVYEAIRNEADKTELSADGMVVQNTTLTPTPFPIPKTGLEAIWNTYFRYRGDTVSRFLAEFPVQTNGAFTPVKREERTLNRQAMPADTTGMLYMFLTFYTAPSSVAGDGVLVHEFVDLAKQPRAAWVYNPGRRRVLRAPEVSFDTPRAGTDGLSIVDEYNGFSGSPERYDWKLLGKKEMYVAYNNYKMTDKSLKYADLIRPQHMNQDYVRYELHRVWALEATLKKGQSHIYAKRMFYLDEDSWQVLHADSYDGRGELWRITEQHGMQFYDAPTFWAASGVFYDLQSRRYVASMLMNEEPPTVFNKPMKAADFTAGALRRQSD